MNQDEKRKYIEELFKLVSTDSILVVKDWNTLERLRCPFVVKARRDVGSCKAGNYYRVEAVKVDQKSLRNVFIVRRTGYFMENFNIINSILGVND
ncbi:MAG: hypothetical protein AB9888_04710 [Bacteroidales bacterium]